MAEVMKCSVCGEPMPEGEQMFKYHGYSGPCPKPPLKPIVMPEADPKAAAEAADAARWREYRESKQTQLMLGAESPEDADRIVDEMIAKRR